MKNLLFIFCLIVNVLGKIDAICPIKTSEGSNLMVNEGKHTNKISIKSTKNYETNSTTTDSSEINNQSITSTNSQITTSTTINKVVNVTTEKSSVKISTVTVPSTTTKITTSVSTNVMSKDKSIYMTTTICYVASCPDSYFVNNNNCECEYCPLNCDSSQGLALKNDECVCICDWYSGFTLSSDGTHCEQEIITTTLPPICSKECNEHYYVDMGLCQCFYCPLKCDSSKGLYLDKISCECVCDWANGYYFDCTTDKCLNINTN